MRALNLFLFYIFIGSYTLSSQTKLITKVTETKCSGFAISKPLSELTISSNFDELTNENKREIEQRHTISKKNKTALSLNNDAIAQTTNGNKEASPPIANWQGLSGSGYPPDPTGAASSTHYFQAVNSQYKVYTKTGGSVPGGGPFNLSGLWSSSNFNADPVILYDKYADRWFLSVLSFSGELLVAVSTSNNPLGSYYTYTFVTVPGVFPDYPKYSIWSDGYYFTSNTGEPFQLGAIDRTKILAGNPSATMISLSLPTTPNVGFFAPLPADADGQLPPYGTPCPAFTHIDDTWGTSNDELRVFKISINWITPSNSTIILDQTLSPTPFNVDFSSSWDDIPQPGTSQKLDAINGVLMFRAQYRRWVGYNSVMLCHSVIVNTTTNQTGVRWYELRQNSTSGSWSIYQEGTYAPDSHFRWMGSLAMDDNGSIGLAYAISSSSLSPSIRYTGRNASDPLGQMTYSETIAITGSGAQLSEVRYGDYSHTALDPDGITFWHTGEYLTSGQVRTRIFSFQIPVSAIGIKEDMLNTEMTILKYENALEVKGIGLINNENVAVDLFDMNGKEISSQIVIPNNNSFQAVIPIMNLKQGIYLVRMGNVKFQKVKKIIID